VTKKSTESVDGGSISSKLGWHVFNMLILYFK
jgi:hypothetical protein